jgi:lipid-A-disaccharide synthase
VYQCSQLARFVARHFVHTRFIAMPNVLADEQILPEFFQTALDPAALADAVWSLLSDESRRRTVKARLKTVAETLGPPGVSYRAALSVLELTGFAAATDCSSSHDEMVDEQLKIRSAV